jgi:hypothetical protein
MSCRGYLGALNNVGIATVAVGGGSISNLGAGRCDFRANVKRGMSLAGDNLALNDNLIAYFTHNVLGVSVLGAGCVLPGDGFFKVTPGGVFLVRALVVAAIQANIVA